MINSSASLKNIIAGEEYFLFLKYGAHQPARRTFIFRVTHLKIRISIGTHFVKIKSFEFNFMRYTKTPDLVENFEENEGSAEAPDNQYANADNLSK